MNRDTLRGRLFWLLAAVVGSVLLIAASVMAQQTLATGASGMARMSAAAIAALDRALPQNRGAGERASLARLGVQISATPPPHSAPQYPLGREVLARLATTRRVPEDLRFDAGEPLRLWFRSRSVPDLWIGLPLEHLREPVARASIWILLLAGAIVWLAAMLIARQLMRPIERVAAAAPDILAGHMPAQLLQGATRETERMVEALAQAARVVREHNSAREQLLIGLSHDLRTPLARLRFALELGDDADARTRVGMLDDIGEMDALIGEALALARGSNDEPRSAVDLAALLRDIAGRFRVQGDVRCDEGVDAVVCVVQPLAVRRALGNLVQNALRHGAEPIELALRMHGDVLELGVRDHGRGPAEAGSGTRGFGIGLSVVRAVATAHRGSLELRTLADGFEAVLILPAG